MQLREDFETEDNNRAMQLYLHKCELFLHTRVLKLKLAMKNSKSHKDNKSNSSQSQNMRVINNTKSYQRQKVVDRKSTRLNSSHANISYAVFCLKKKNTQNKKPLTFLYLQHSFYTLFLTLNPISTTIPLV